MWRTLMKLLVLRDSYCPYLSKTVCQEVAGIVWGLLVATKGDKRSSSRFLEFVQNVCGQKYFFFICEAKHRAREWEREHITLIDQNDANASVWHLKVYMKRQRLLWFCTVFTHNFFSWVCRLYLRVPENKVAATPANCPPVVTQLLIVSLPCFAIIWYLIPGCVLQCGCG